jgi:regulator of nucleoside diphosphate kinase
MSLPLDVCRESKASATIPAVDRATALIAPAVAAAVASARWEMADLVARRGRDLAPDLLRGRAAELALSPLAEDQILSVILEAAAGALEQGQASVGAATPLDGPSPADRTVSIRVADQVHWLQASPADEAWVSDLVARRRSLGLSATGLAARLAEDAGLQALLCHDPRIPADADLRRRMAAIVPLIVRRGRELNPNWWRRHFQKLSDQSLSHPTESRAAHDRPPIVLCATDHERLLRLACAALLSEPRAASPLLREIERAAVVPDHDLPIEAVRLGDRVGYSDRISGKFRKVRLVGRRRKRDPAVLSVLTPVGSALIGLSVGETIHWKDHFGLETIVTVRTVEHDAEC